MWQLPPGFNCPLASAASSPFLAVNLTISLFYVWLLILSLHHCRFPWPWDTHLLERRQYRESLGNAPFWRKPIAISPLLCAFLPLASPRSVPSLHWGPSICLLTFCVVFHSQKFCKSCQINSHICLWVRDRLEACFLLLWSCFVALTYNGKHSRPATATPPIAIQGKHWFRHFQKESSTCLTICLTLFCFLEPLTRYFQEVLNLLICLCCFLIVYLWIFWFCHALLVVLEKDTKLVRFDLFCVYFSHPADDLHKTQVAYGTWYPSKIYEFFPYRSKFVLLCLPPVYGSPYHLRTY